MKIALRDLMITVALLSGITSYAQDTLYYTNGTRIAGQVEEIGIDQVRYRTSSGANSVLVTAEKRDLEKIRLQNGQEFVYNIVLTEQTTPKEFNGRKNALSFDVMAPALNHVVFGYERVTGKHSSVQVKLGFIGLYNNNKQDSFWDNSFWRSTGGLGKVGVKLFLPPSPKRIHPPTAYHPLVGWYLKPEFMISAWTRRSQEYFYDPIYYGSSNQVKTDNISIALNLMAGRQMLLGNRVTFDVFGGLGYGTRWVNGQLGNDTRYHNNLYSFTHAFFDRTSPLTISGGMMFGFVF